MTMNARILLSAAAMSVLALGTVTTSIASEPGKPAAPDTTHTPTKTEKRIEKLSDEKSNIGTKAPAFTLKDTEGKEVKLESFAGKIVVLEWFNPGCPYIVRHHKEQTTFKDLFEKYKGNKDVVILAINSSAPGKEGHGVELNAKMKKEWKIEYPILIDESGQTGKAYGAKTTPHMFVLAKDGTIAYNGAIDDASRGGTPKEKYVEKAVDALLAGKSVETSTSKPYGCGVKYAK